MSQAMLVMGLEVGDGVFGGGGVEVWYCYVCDRGVEGRG